MEPFQFGWPEARAVALAVAIIGTWAVLRYARTTRPKQDEKAANDDQNG